MTQYNLGKDEHIHGNHAAPPAVCSEFRASGNYEAVDVGHPLANWFPHSSGITPATYADISCYCESIQPTTTYCYENLTPQLSRSGLLRYSIVNSFFVLIFVCWSVWTWRFKTLHDDFKLFHEKREPCFILLRFIKSNGLIGILIKI